MTAKAIAEALGVTPAAVRHHCRQGQLTGAVCEATARGPVWLVPARYAERAVYAAAIGRKPHAE